MGYLHAPVEKLRWHACIERTRCSTILKAAAKQTEGPAQNRGAARETDCGLLHIRSGGMPPANLPSRMWRSRSWTALCTKDTLLLLTKLARFGGYLA